MFYCIYHICLSGRVDHAKQWAHNQTRIETEHCMVLLNYIVWQYVNGHSYALANTTQLIGQHQEFGTIFGNILSEN